MHISLTDAEYALLHPLIPHHGRPAQDRRRVLDAIFHVALSRRPWHEMPARFGKADSVHRQLRRWMRAGVMDALLRAAMTPGFASLRTRISLAWRRAARVASMASFALLRELDAREARPAAWHHLPDRALSETVQKVVSRALENPWRIPRGLLTLCGKLLKQAGGDPRKWRTR
jgi:transposase